MFLWGGLSMCMAAAHSWQVIAGLRFILGILEASFAPGVLFLLSAWYKKSELGRRYSMYYTAVALSGMFGGLIAGGLLQTLDGSHGISGWRWLLFVPVSFFYRFPSFMISIVPGSITLRSLTSD